MDSSNLRLAVIGLDTSHAPAFTRMLNNPSDPYHLSGGRVVKAWPGGSEDFELSWSRVAQFTEEVRQMGVTICGTIEEAAEDCDAVLLESADGRVHLEQFKKLIPFKVPVFIDKPFTCSLKEAKELIHLAEKHHIPVMSSSSLRFLQGLPGTVAKHREQITGVELRGPLAFQETQPGYFWCGIHTFEMLFAVLGPDYCSLDITRTESADSIRACWPGGIHAHIELVREKAPFDGALICGNRKVPLPSSDRTTEPFYYSLLKEVLRGFKTREFPVSLSETAELIKFIEEANSLQSGKGQSAL